MPPPVACSLRFRAAARAPTTPKPVARRRARSVLGFACARAPRGRLRGQVGVVVSVFATEWLKQPTYDRAWLVAWRRCSCADLQRPACDRAPREGARSAPARVIHVGPSWGAVTEP